MTRSNKKQPDKRRQLITLIHIAKSELKVDEDVYRGILQGIGNKNSASELGVPQLEQVLEHLKKCGFKVRSKSGTGVEKPSRPLAQDPESRKVRALWLLLHELGAVKNSSEAALAAYAKRITGVEALQWLKGDQAERLIESLKKWALRYLPAAVKEQAGQCRELSMPPEERAQLNDVVRDALHRGTFDPIEAAFQRTKEVLEKRREPCLQ